MVLYIYDSSAREKETGALEFKAVLGYIANLKPI